jgi:hypothetical protein
LGLLALGDDADIGGCAISKVFKLDQGIFIGYNKAMIPWLPLLPNHDDQIVWSKSGGKVRLGKGGEKGYSMCKEAMP